MCKVVKGAELVTQTTGHRQEMNRVQMRSRKSQTEIAKKKSTCFSLSPEKYFTKEGKYIVKEKQKFVLRVTGESVGRDHFLVAVRGKPGIAKSPFIPGSVPGPSLTHAAIILTPHLYWCSVEHKNNCSVR